MSYIMTSARIGILPNAKCHHLSILKDAGFIFPGFPEDANPKYILPLPLSMKAHIQCIPCFLKQAVDVIRMTDVGWETGREVMNRLMDYMQEADLDRSPPELSMELHSIIREMTGIADPYSKAKKESTETAQRLLPHLGELMESSPDALALSVKIGAAGNVIDYGTFHMLDLEEVVDSSVKRDLTVWDYDDFGNDLAGAKKVLVLGDNTGEILFDRFLLRQMKDMNLDITYAVRSGPIINDATMEDAMEAGIDEFATVISGGSQSPGTLLEHITKELEKAFRKADLIISKGQGNFETLSRNRTLGDFARVGVPVYFILTVKCTHVAEFAGVPSGSTIFRREIVG